VRLHGARPLPAPPRPRAPRPPPPPPPRAPTPVPPYPRAQYAVDRVISTDVLLQKKHVDDVLGAEDEFKGAQETEKTCEKCDHNKAYFFTVQIRSADEPTTEFYRCVKCGHNWREG